MECCAEFIDGDWIYLGELSESPTVPRSAPGNEQGPCR
ncbi:hypothetical protein ABH925_002474 [Streptacidiphilus sp. EB129]